MGQNFLTGGAVIRRLVRRAKIRPGDRVIEIGAGKGHITRELLRVGAEVTARLVRPLLPRVDGGRRSAGGVSSVPLLRRGAAVHPAEISKKKHGFTPCFCLFLRDFLPSKRQNLMTSGSLVNDSMVAVASLK